MGKIRLGSKEIKYMTIFEMLTGARIKDCIQVENTIGFLVDKGDMGLAIGKNGSNIERVKEKMDKGVWLVEFSEEPNKFVRNLLQPVKVKQVRIHNSDNEKIAIVEIGRFDRKKALGHGGSRIKIAKSLLERHHDISDIKLKIV